MMILQYIYDVCHKINTRKQFYIKLNDNQTFLSRLNSKKFRKCFLASNIIHSHCLPFLVKRSDKCLKISCCDWLGKLVESVIVFVCISAKLLFKRKKFWKLINYIMFDIRGINASVQESI